MRRGALPDARRRVPRQAQIIVYAGAIMVFRLRDHGALPGKEETGPDPRKPGGCSQRRRAVRCCWSWSCWWPRARPRRRHGSTASGSVPPSAPALHRLPASFELTSVLLLAGHGGRPAASPGVVRAPPSRRAPRPRRAACKRAAAARRARGGRPIDPRSWYLTLSAGLFTIGVVGVVIAGTHS